MSDRCSEDEETNDEEAHLANLKGSCGCVEIWEHLSEQRRAD